MEEKKIPSAFLWRKLQSFAGLGLVIYLISHLLTNSQAAFPIGENGQKFVHMVNSIHELPFLLAIEIFIIVLPLLIHSIWGVYYLYSAKINSIATDGTTPSLPEYKENKGYTWQRITSVLLLFAIGAHVIHMRVLHYPGSITEGNQQFYTMQVTEDPSLNAIAEKLNVHLVESDLGSDNKLAIANDFGTAELLLVRESFKKPWLMFLYTIFVLAACYHAFNGVWSFLITWGITLTRRAQRLSRILCYIGMGLLSFLGLSAIYLTYWVNLS